MTGPQWHGPLIAWFAQHQRDLPWRSDPSPWRVMVSEFMLQQTPVSRVLPVFEAWMERWPQPADLAAEPAGEAVRAWGRLGYPRRALRLHAAAKAIVADHRGTVPDDFEALLALPGVGDYTASAIASFAFGRRHVVLDTNVRRVFARAGAGVQFAHKNVTATERALAETLLPDYGADRWAAATMELGAIVCTAKSPACDRCPIAGTCAWRAAGYPAWDGPTRRAQAYEGTDRQCRGRLLGVLRDAHGPVPKPALDAVWPDADQRERALDSLLDDGLVTIVGEDQFALP